MKRAFMYLKFFFLSFIIVICSQLNAQDVVIEEVYYNPTAGVSKRIALRNVSGSTQNISNWCLCNFPSYQTISTASAFTVLQGNPSSLGPNQLLILELTGSGFDFDNTSELALYHTSGCFGFTTASNMEDYVVWGSSGTRAPVAVSANLWTSSSAFVAAAPTGHVLVFDGTNTGPGNISSPNDFSNQPMAILPLKLDHFTASLEANEKDVMLRWVTFKEIDVKCFKIRKSLDGKEFSELSTVNAKGNTNRTTHYSFKDFDIENKRVLYYQLEIVGSNGFSNFTHIISVHSKFRKNTFSLYPNPAIAGESIIINANSNFDNDSWSVKVFDANGQIYYFGAPELIQVSESQIRIPAFGASSGYYIIKIYKNESLESLIPLIIH